MKITLKVVPSSSKDVICGTLGKAIKVKVQAPPEKGKANKAVLKLLSKAIQIPTSAIELISGDTASTKIIEIDDSYQAECLKWLENIDE